MHSFVHSFSGHMCGRGSNAKLNEVDEEEEPHRIPESHEYCRSFPAIDAGNADNFHLLL